MTKQLVFGVAIFFYQNEEGDAVGSILYLDSIFLSKVMDNALSTTKTILIQKSWWLLAGIAVVIFNLNDLVEVRFAIAANVSINLLLLCSLLIRLYRICLFRQVQYYFRRSDFREEWLRWQIVSENVRKF